MPDLSPTASSADLDRQDRLASTVFGVDYLEERKRHLDYLSGLSWRRLAAPDAIGIWIVQELPFGDLSVWEVSIDPDTDSEAAEFEDHIPQPYLRFNDGGSSEPLRDLTSPPYTCLGPFPLPPQDRSGKITVP